MSLRIRLLTALVALSLLTPTSGALLVSAQTPEQQRTPSTLKLRKMTADLVARTDSVRQGSRETARVLLSVAEGQTVSGAASLLEAAGAQVRERLDSVGYVVADVAVDKLAARDEVAWVSPEQPVRSTAASLDNTSHHEVATGASKMLPVGNEALATEGWVMVDGYLRPDGTYLFPNGYTLRIGILMGNSYTPGRSGILMGDGLTSSGVRVNSTFTNEAAWGSNMIEPSSMRLKEEQVLLQGEAAMPTSVTRLGASSPLYPRR